MFRTAKVGRFNQAGFTLVELMVVVAIIGILAAIAIPNFQRYQAKSRQKEAQIGLAAAYTAMRTFQSEQGTYSACLEQSGYIPTGDPTIAGVPGGRRWYTHGFSATTAALTICGPDGATTCLRFNFSPVQNCTDAAVTFGAALGVSDLAYAATQTVNATAASGGLLDQADLDAADALTATTFVIPAIGNISDIAGAAGIDTWTIDQNKQISNTNVGM